MYSDKGCSLTMSVEIKIWDLPRAEKEALKFFQDEELLPKT